MKIGFVVADNVINLPVSRSHLACPKCQATTEVKCDCGVDYVYVKASVIAEKAIMEHPEKSDRAIAAETGVSKDTVRKVRNSTGDLPPVEKRVGLDGKKRRILRGAGGRVRIPNGYASVSEAVLAGIAMERQGMPMPEVIKKIPMAHSAYSVGRDVLLLSQRSDLSARDAAIVAKALREINETHQLNGAANLVKPIATRVWGKKGNRYKTDKKRLDDFQSSISYVLSTCETAADIEIPYLSDQHRTSAINELREAKAALRTLEMRIRKGYGAAS